MQLTLRSRWKWPRGRLEASSIGGYSSAGHACNGSDGYAVPMADSGGSKLVIFVAPAAHSHELSLSFVTARRPCWLGRLCTRERPVTSAAPVCVNRLAFTICSASTAFQRDPLGQVVNRDHLPGMPADQASKWSSHHAHLPVVNDAIATLARVGKAAAHGTSAGWHSGCRCTCAERHTATDREHSAEP